MDGVKGVDEVMRGRTGGWGKEGVDGVMRAGRMDEYGGG